MGSATTASGVSFNIVHYIILQYMYKDVVNCLSKSLHFG